MDSKKSFEERYPRLNRLIEWFRQQYFYCAEGVWSDDANGFKQKLVKTINLSVQSFLNKDIQSTACAMAFRTLLAIVPALALIFAIGRGFGFDNLLKTTLLGYFPAQREVLERGFSFVDSYLNQASGGIFIGVGILFLLWTLFSLVSSAEIALNKIWSVPGRTVWRQLTDYMAIIFLLPVLMICSTGINVLMSSALQVVLPFEAMSPLISTLVDLSSVVLIWLFFAGVYKLLPNARVKFSNALIAGVLSGTAFTILQWLFVSGQIYVSKYNAIYGSFAFLPLLMLWMQLVWVITLAGAVLCFSSQNFVLYSYSKQISNISFDYRRKILFAVMAVICRHYKKQETPPDANDFAQLYGIPIKLVTQIIEELRCCGLVLKVEVDEKTHQVGYVPAVDLQDLTVGHILHELRNHGDDDFIINFDTDFKEVSELISHISIKLYDDYNDIKIADLDYTEDTPKNNN
ncbi:MAG: YihY/virulence factor BrkB family protein [Muribaculaceae bacterium]|nr:YihY/virulence factor BrkB family protein [Muribaculaceae bacterium]